MDPTSREDLSALMDGELAAEPTRFLLRRLEHDPDLSATWSRWHLIRACLVSDPVRMSEPKADTDFASRVAASVAADHAPRQQRRHWVQYVGGGALAAGVAVAALMLNVPNTPVGQPASVAQSRPAAQGAQTLAVTAPAASAVTSPWLLARQPTVLAAQPAAANVIYGTGLMQPDYLRRAAYAQGVSNAVTAPALQGDDSNQPFSIVIVPAPASSTAATRH
ncbi:MAG TPA: sigma-E factor negative regulatory protein [Rhodanobacteraceae bacterium]|nr:sigma-E factor negative regulatory protein [Rhodanobacteraceae bacterium]